MTPRPRFRNHLPFVSLSAKGRMPFRLFVQPAPFSTASGAISADSRPLEAALSLAPPATLFFKPVPLCARRAASDLNPHNHVSPSAV